MTVQELNDDLVFRLGGTPCGDGRYKWIHSESFTHLMKVQGDSEVIQRDGIWLVQPKYVARKMCPDLEDTWILAHWHEPISQYQWEQQHGTLLLWPREGYYVPTNILLSPGEAPTQTSNDQAVYLIKKQREKTMADLRDDGERLMDRKEKRFANTVSDRIDDAVSAFCAVPGTKGNVSFPTVEKTA